MTEGIEAQFGGEAHFFRSIVLRSCHAFTLAVGLERTLAIAPLASAGRADVAGARHVGLLIYACIRSRRPGIACSARGLRVHGYVVLDKDGRMVGRLMPKVVARGRPTPGLRLVVNNTK